MIDDNENDRRPLTPEEEAQVKAMSDLWNALSDEDKIAFMKWAGLTSAYIAELVDDGGATRPS